MHEPLVEIRNLQTHFFTDVGVVKAVDDVTLTIPRGQTLGLVGESGCGKSVTAMSVIRLIASPGRIVGGSILFHEARRGAAQKSPGGRPAPLDLARLPESQMQPLRGSRIAMIFQEPMTSLNPVFTVGAQIMEAIRIHKQVSRHEARLQAIELLRKVKVPVPEQRVDEYPHQFSGGMRQRVMIAMSLACDPELLIADEPTTALDVTIQAQILDLLRSLQAENGMSILLITHDLGVIAEMADQVAVMYASKVVEQASVSDLFANARHPYTRGLFESLPRPGMGKEQRLNSIRGMVPSPLHFPAGCKFHPRCPYVQDRCRGEEPELVPWNPAQLVRCHFAKEIEYVPLAE